MTRLYETMTNLFLIGAGFDRALFGPSMPLNDELLDWVMQRQIDQDWVRRRARYNTTNIEEFLTYFDLDVLRNPTPSSSPGMSTEEASRDLFNQVLSTTFLQSFRLTDSMAQQPWAITLTKNILRPHDVLVSLNYSHLLDSLLDSAEIWNPNGGYSRYVTNINLDTSPSIPPNSALKDIRLYKIHGSCHFYRVAFSDRPDLQQINFPVEPEIFPISGANSHFGPGIPNRGHYIVAPSFVKIPHIQLTFMFLDVLEHVKSTQNLVVLGCNLRYEDQALWLMLSKFLSGPPNGRKIIILQPNAEEVRKRMVKHLSWMAMAWDSFIIAIPKTIEAGARDLLEYL